MPINSASAEAMSKPATLQRRERFIRSRSPSVVAKASAMFGVSSGAMTMAPMITATLLW